MASESPLALTAWSKAFQRQRPIDALIRAEVNPLRNKVGTATFAVPSDHPVNAWLQVEGARVTCEYLKGLELSGPVRLQAPQLQVNGETAYTVQDDLRILANTLGWVRPVASGSSQGQIQAQALADDAQAVSTVAHTAGTDSGYGAYVFDAQAAGASALTAEAAIKELVTRNVVTRLGRPVTVAADQGRGGNALAAGKLPVVRFMPLLDVLQDLLTWSGLTLRMRQSLTPGQGFLFDVYPGKPYPSKLTLDSGIITEGTGQRAAPNATRAVVGGPGDDTGRAWYSVADTAREALWGDIIEVLKDGGSVSPKWSTSVSSAYQVPKYFHLQSANGADVIAAFLNALAALGQESLTDGAPRSGLSMTLAETATFRYGGGGVSIGDSVPVQATPATETSAAVILSGVVSGATISLSESGGVTAKAQVGERTDDPDKDLADAIAGVQTALRRRAARK